MSVASETAGRAEAGGARRHAIPLRPTACLSRTKLSSEARRR